MSHIHAVLAGSVCLAATACGGSDGTGNGGTGSGGTGSGGTGSGGDAQAAPNYAVEVAGSQFSFVDVGNVPIPDNFTLELWVKVASDQPTGENVILSKEELEGIPENQFRVALSNGQLVFNMTDATGEGGGLWNGQYYLRTVDQVSRDVWMQLAITKAGMLFNLYLNGVPQTSVTTTVTLSHTGSRSMRFGGHDSADPNWFHGAIDEVRLWNVARSATDILADMPRPIANSRADFALLGAYWRLDEGTGTVAADARGTWNGVLSSATWSASGAPLLY